MRQKRMRTDCPTPSPLQFFHSSKPTKSLRGTLVNVKDPLPTPEQLMFGAPHPIPGLSQCVRGPNRSTAPYTRERTQRRRQTIG